MTILSGQSIRARRMIEPFSERAICDGMTYGLSGAGYDCRIAQSIALPPGRFALASTMEHFTMPHDLAGVVHDKSTWARQGLAVQNTVIEPGWRGFLTLELSNHSEEWITITEGRPIAQILFYLTDQPVEHPYDGRYQDQEAGPQPARWEPFP